MASWLIPSHLWSTSASVSFALVSSASPVPALSITLPTAPSPGGIPAEHRFAKRRLEHLSQWKPTKTELRLLGELVNRKAGCELL